MPKNASPGDYLRDLRKYSRQTNVQLLAGFFIILVIIGLGLIAWIYGPSSAVLGLLCILGALTPIALIIGFLFILDLIVKNANK
jgi:hypothetical protein